MNLDLLSYVKVYKAIIPKSLCDKSLDELSHASWRLNEFYNYKQNTVSQQSGDKECYMYEGDITTIDDLTTIVHDCINEYLKQLNFPWYNSYYGTTKLRFNRYIENTLMKEHCDHINSIFDGNIKGVPTLSVLGLLGSEFTGGDLIMCGGNKVDFEGGDIIVFPSNFLYPHKIELVNSGIRTSFVSWVV